MVKVLTFQDILNQEFPDCSFAVLGDPVAHSLSPAMHQAALQVLANEHPQFKNVKYLPLHIKAEELAATLPLLHRKKFIGLNLTVPHKVAVLPLVKSLSPAAEKAGSVNTLVLTKDGWAGHTTDGQGFLSALEEYSGSGVHNKPVLILGAGGAARAIASCCLDAQCSRLIIANRDVAKAKNLAESFNDSRVDARELKEIQSLSPGTIVVNCTTLGLRPEDPSPLEINLIKGAEFIFDTTYGQHSSALIQIAQKHGVKNCDGRAMLRWQGTLAFKLWTGITPPQTPMRIALGEK